MNTEPEPETIPRSDDAQEITNLLTDAIESAYGMGLNLHEVIVLACEGWLEQDTENVIDPGLARILARISAERVRLDLAQRPKPRARRTRMPRVALKSPLEEQPPT